MIWLRTATGSTKPFDAETVDDNDAHYIRGKHHLHSTICPYTNYLLKPKIMKGCIINEKI
jgi:hypothetical protein